MIIGNVLNNEATKFASNLIKEDDNGIYIKSCIS